MTEAERYEVVAAVKTWQDLTSAVDQLGSIRGSQREYPMEELHDLVRVFKTGRYLPDIFPRTYGFRAKVVELALALGWSDKP